MMTEFNAVPENLFHDGSNSHWFILLPILKIFSKI